MHTRRHGRTGPDISAGRRRGRFGLPAMRLARPIALAVAVAALPIVALAAPAVTARPAGSAMRIIPSGALAQDSQGAADTVPAPPSGWTTQFSDDFNGAAGDGVGSQWKYDTGVGSTFGENGQIETMTNSAGNVRLDGRGDLDITALGSGSKWTSSRIQTTSASVGAPAGGELEVTASIQQPNPASGDGYWPAFWVIGPGQWPATGEMDIMESVNALSEVEGVAHCGTNPGGPCDEPAGIGSMLRACSGCQTGYHTYTMIENRTNPSDESVNFYLDRKKYFSVSERQVGTSAWQAAFDHKMSIIFDLAMGGVFPDFMCRCTAPTSATSSGGTMSVQYVAAYTRSGSGGAPHTGPIAG